MTPSDAILSRKVITIHLKEILKTRSQYVGSTVVDNIIYPKCTERYCLIVKHEFTPTECDV